MLAEMFVSYHLHCIISYNKTTINYTKYAFKT